MGNALANEALMGWVLLLFQRTAKSQELTAFCTSLPPGGKQLSQEGASAGSNPLTKYRNLLVSLRRMVK